MIHIDRPSFFDGFRAAFGKLTQSQVVGLETLLGFIEADPLPDMRWIAYLLATTKHECADTWMPIEERGQRPYFDKYEPGTEIGKVLGNSQLGDGYLFRGRGYVQLTGRGNYRTMGDLLGADLVGNPDLAKVPLTAYQIACVGMAKGLFTGKKLGDYIHDTGTDWVTARRVINGMDRGALIAGYAKSFHAILRVSPTPPDAQVGQVDTQSRGDYERLAGAVRKTIDELEKALAA